uniref:Uncharacterized protein n=1 Tax=Rhizophora mucronata TaxID=61149 RepID=A0A2P2LL11_RHIMU
MHLKAGPLLAMVRLWGPGIRVMLKLSYVIQSITATKCMVGSSVRTKLSIEL